MDQEVKDVIIGGATNYDWNKLQYWVRSIKQTGFTGDIVIVGTNLSGDTVKKLRENDVIIQAYGKPTEDGGFEYDSKTAPHVERFIYIYDYLKKHKEEYRFAIVTDTRDVIFQSDPSPWLNENVNLFKSLVAASEGLAYKHEPWGDKNLLDTFGKYIYDDMKDNVIYNVGTIAGAIEEVSDLLLFIFQLSINRPIPIVDQAVYNFILQLSPYRYETLYTDNSSGWSVQLGTSLPAIEAGAGDIGQAVKVNKDLLQDYKDVYQTVQPDIREHEVFTPEGDKYCIVHQWDRVPELKEKVEKHYGDDECSEILIYTT